MNQITQEMLLDAAYLMQGFRNKLNGAQRLAAHECELDTVAALVEWSPRLNSIFSALSAAQVFPQGVFSYEVTETLGEAIGSMVKKQGLWPEDREIWPAAQASLKSCYGYDTLDPIDKMAFDSVMAKACGIQSAGAPIQHELGAA